MAMWVKYFQNALGLVADWLNIQEVIIFFTVSRKRVSIVQNYYMHCVYSVCVCIHCNTPMSIHVHRCVCQKQRGECVRDRDH